jgi:primase-polymerase (primpol)-like protein
VPEELKELPAWLTWHWRWDEAKKKYTKQPKTLLKDPETGKFSYAKAHCLRPLHEVMDYLSSRPRLGLGFSFHFHQPWPLVGIDLDDSRDPATGKLTEFAREVVEMVNSYTEVSVSGKGLHILARAEIPRSRRKSGDRYEGRAIEMYGRTGYFAFTGRRLEDTPARLEHRQEVINTLYLREFPEDGPVHSRAERGRARGRSGKRRSAVDRSAADYARVKTLLRAGRQPEEVYQLMQNSPIAQRSKWGKRDENYRWGVINAAHGSLKKD